MLDYLLSDKGQAIWANAYLRPARPIELPPEVKAKFLPASDYARAKSVDWAKMAEVQKGFTDRYLPKCVEASWCSGSRRAPCVMTAHSFVRLCLLPLAVVVDGVLPAADGAARARRRQRAELGLSCLRGRS